ncbi:MAG: DUF4258 domain-containing protein [Candidatus Desantisbacteria bacterium]
MDVVFSEHAIFEMQRRQIDKQTVADMVKNPQQKILSKKERVIAQGKYIDYDENKEMLLRIIGKEKKGVFYVITVYQTSKIEKYWIKEVSNEGYL